MAVVEKLGGGVHPVDIRILDRRHVVTHSSS
jgi:hypothetical protein